MPKKWDPLADSFILTKAEIEQQVASDLARFRTEYSAKYDGALSNQFDVEMFISVLWGFNVAYEEMEQEIRARTRELKEQYLKDRTILTSIHHGVVVTDRNGTVTDANPAAVAMMGAERSEQAIREPGADAKPAAYAEPLIVKTARHRFDIQAPHFSIYVRQQLNRMFGEDFVNRNGLKVYTTLDLDLQRQVECAARTQLLRLSGGDPNGVIPAEGSQTCEAAALLPDLRPQDAGVDHHLSNVAVMVMRPATGEILAMLGSADYWNDAIDGRFNVATDGSRQPGSSFKPFTYLTAFAQGYSPASMLLDVRTVFIPPGGGAPYVPDNYDRRFHGPVRMRVALQRSYNVPAVQTMNLVGVDNVIRTAHRMGINTLDQAANFYGLALTLGGGEVTLADMTYAYGVIANGGVMAGTPVPGADRRPGYRTLDPAAILRVEDRAGRVLYQYDRPETQTILSSQLAYLMENVMSDEQARWAYWHRQRFEAYGHRGTTRPPAPAGGQGQPRSCIVCHPAQTPQMKRVG